MAIIIVGLILVFVLGVIIFINFAPQFGGGLTKEQIKSFESKAHFEKGKFLNFEAVDMDFGFDKIRKIMKAMNNSEAEKSPKSSITTIDILAEDITKDAGFKKITWLGHSTILLQLEGKTILIDPMFSQRPSPISFMGGKRFYEVLPLEIDELPQLDLIVISHDHYDHLDFKSIRELNEKTDHFWVPLGVDNHLLKWGVSQGKIQVFDWWDKADLEELELVFTPSRHFSGRGLGDRFTTLWGGWVIKSENTKLYFSGDSGFGSHFKEIGEKYGPFDLAMMECGQYNENWPDVHMLPEETVQASIDIKAERVLPIHWGAFSLAPHDWRDPVERIKDAAEGKNVEILTPMIGETFNIQDKGQVFDEWWDNSTE